MVEILFRHLSEIIFKKIDFFVIHWDKVQLKKYCNLKSVIRKSYAYKINK